MRLEKRIGWEVIAISVIGGALIALCGLGNSGCADLGSSEPVATVSLAVTEPWMPVQPDDNDVYQVSQRTWYTLSVTTDDPTDTVGEVVYIGDGPELGWRGFRYLLTDIAENGTLRTASVTITRDGRQYSKEIVFQVSYSIP